MCLTVYVGPYLHINSTEEVDKFLDELAILRDGWMEGNPDLDSSVWILDDSEGLFDRACEFALERDNPASTAISPPEIDRELVIFLEHVKDVMKDIKRLDPMSLAEIQWGVLCCWS